MTAQRKRTNNLIGNTVQANNKEDTLNEAPGRKRMGDSKSHNKHSTRHGIKQFLVAAIPGGDWAAKNGPEDDKVFMNTTLTAHAKVGGKLKRIDKVDFGADFQDTKHENLAITGHGSPGKIGNEPAIDIANYLTDSTKGLKTSHRIPGIIYFESCFAAAADPKNGKVIKVVKDELDRHLNGVNVPTIIGSAGPQITTNIKKHGSGSVDIKKTVVEGNKASYKYIAAGCTQLCLYAKYYDAGKEVKTRLDGSDEGAAFIKEAKKSEDKVSNLKWIFINVVKGTPLKEDDYNAIQSGLRDDLINEWDTKGYSAYTGGFTGDDIFKNGKDLRDPTGQETLLNLPKNDRITEDYVQNLIDSDDQYTLEHIFRSKKYPLSKWDGEAWSKFLDWLTSS